jgi:hypothetical protein
LSQSLTAKWHITMPDGRKGGDVFAKSKIYSRPALPWRARGSVDNQSGDTGELSGSSIRAIPAAFDRVVYAVTGTYVLFRPTIVLPPLKARFFLTMECSTLSEVAPLAPTRAVGGHKVTTGSISLRFVHDQSNASGRQREWRSSSLNKSIWSNARSREPGRA